MGKRKALMKASELREKRKKRREQLSEVLFVLEHSYLVCYSCVLSAFDLSSQKVSFLIY